MIHIEQNQAIPENENIRVLSPSGDYNDTDPIEYYSAEEPGVAQGAFHAQFIKYGGLVYRFSDPKELGEEILKIDPESTHSAASFVRMQNELLKQFDQGSLEPNSLNQVMETEQIKMEDEMVNNGTSEESENIESEPSPDLEINSDSDNTDSVTDSVIDDISTTTPAVFPDLPLDDSPATTTPELEATSTASEIISYAKKTIKKNITKKIRNKILG